MRHKVEFGGGERRTTYNTLKGMKSIVIESRNMLLLSVRTLQKFGKSSPFLFPSTEGFGILLEWV